MALVDFPKSHSIEKALRKQEHEEEADQFSGYGTGLKPSYEPILLCQKPIDSTFANNALTWGVAGLNIDGGRIPTSDDTSRPLSFQQGWKQTSPSGSGTIDDNWKKGRFPANLILSHHSECVKVGTREVKTGMHIGHNLDETNKSTNTVYGTYNQDTNDAGYANADGFEFVSAYDCHPQCPIRMLGEQAGILTSGDHKGFKKGTRQGNCYGLQPQFSTFSRKGDTGSAARYFLNLDGETRFFYCSKASRRERNEGLEGMEKGYNDFQRASSGLSRANGDKDGSKGTRSQPQQNTNPCVKPLKLMEYLCILTRTPTGGVVLDPFAGSGSTGVACINTGRDFIGIEQDAEYYTITERRIEHAQQQVRQMELAL